MYKRLVILSAIILAGLCGLVLLGYHSVQIWARGMEGERLGQFVEVAEDIKKDVNRKMDEFMAREESRPYTEYQNYYVPDNTVTVQQQAPILRSPLAGRLGEGLAYGQFQIDSRGAIITPNTGVQLADNFEQVGDLIARNDKNIDNVRYNLLPALTKDNSSYAEMGRDLTEVSSLVDKEVLYKQVQAIANEGAQKRSSKSKPIKGSRRQSFPIESFQNPQQKTQIVNRSRVFVNQDFASNSQTYMPQWQDYDQSVQRMVQAKSEGSPQLAANQGDDKDAITPSEQVGETQELSDEYRSSRAKADAETQESEQQSVVALIQPEPGQLAEPGYEYTRQAAAELDRWRRHLESQAETNSTIGLRSLSQQPPQPQAKDAQVEADMVQVRIEPLVPVRAPCKEGEESVFGAQIFMLRHVQIEDRHFIQGFQLNEKELIKEVEESAQRLTRPGMNYELAQKVNGTSAFTAILDFGFGDLILNLIEIDPSRIARKIKGMQTWYFGIITVVFLAVSLALASLWHNARAQLRLARKKDDFISAVSHELRTPLTSIRMYSEMLEKNWVKSEDKVGEYYKNMRQESERLSRLIENVLDFSRIQRDRKSYDFNLGDINKSVADVVEMMRPYAAQNGFTIVTQLGEIRPTVFDADAVTQIVVNLLDNAIKYANGAEDKTIIVRTGGNHDFLMIEVEDHGPGVPHRQRKKIFEEFYRIGAEATRETTGTGLGLALVKKFAQAHNGFVEILNARPKGSIFRVAIAAQA
ncbi:MAG: sensor histidine kinase [Planctomycetota bacterium]|jgi:signal transduction histidine kinase